MFRFDTENVASENWLKDFVEEVYTVGHEPQNAIDEFVTALVQEHAPEALKSHEEYNFVGGQMPAVEHDEGHESTPEVGINEIANMLRDDASQPAMDFDSHQNFVESLGGAHAARLILPETSSRSDALASSFQPMFQKPSGTPGGGPNKDGDGGTDGGTTDDGGTTSEPSLFWTYKSGAEDVYGTDGALITDHYNIEIDFYGNYDDWGAVKGVDGEYSGGFIDAFKGAADYLSSIIVGGLHADFWDGRDVDDVVIRANLVSIDGAGGVLGQAGPETARDFDLDGVIDGLTVTGIMEFDTADAGILQNGGSFGAGSSIEGGLWYDTVLHEMMHVLGFGTFWGVSNEQIDGDLVVDGYSYSGVPTWDLVGGTAEFDYDNGTRRPNDDQFHYDYLGSANDFYDEDYNEFTLSVEANGGAGTAGGHWDEYVHHNEIMTGYINDERDESGLFNYMADYTIAALADLGYDLASDNYQAMATAGTQFLALDDPLVMA